MEQRALDEEQRDLAEAIAQIEKWQREEGERRKREEEEEAAFLEKARVQAIEDTFSFLAGKLRMLQISQKSSMASRHEEVTDLDIQISSRDTLITAMKDHHNLELTVMAVRHRADSKTLIDSIRTHYPSSFAEAKPTFEALAEQQNLEIGTLQYHHTRQIQRCQARHDSEQKHNRKERRQKMKADWKWMEVAEQFAAEWLFAEKEHWLRSGADASDIQPGEG